MCSCTLQTYVLPAPPGAMVSIPRDLLVDIPGVGNQVKINSAYEIFGERGAVRTVKKLLSVGGRKFAISDGDGVDMGGPHPGEVRPVPGGEAGLA